MASDVFRYQMDLAINELVARLPPEEADALRNTRWLYADRPTPAEMAAAGVPAAAIMLGLYMAPSRYTRAQLLDPALPAPTITIYEAAARRTGYSARAIVTHEAGHRLGYDHDSEAVIPCGTEYTAMPEIVRAVESLMTAAPISCYC